MMLTVFQNIPSLYRSAVFAALSQIAELQIYYFSYTHKDRYWIEDKSVLAGLEKVKYHFIPGFDMHILGIPDGRTVINQIFFFENFGNVCILTGYASVADWQALFWLKLRGYPIVLWYASTISTHKISFQSLGGIAKKFFLRNVDSFVTYGTEATKSLIAQGVKQEKIVTGCNVTDANFFTFQQRPVREVNTPFRWFYSGQLIHRKGLDLFLDAISTIEKLPNWILKVAGTGSMMKVYQAKAIDLGLQDQVTFLGSQNYEELREHYLQSDGLVFLSRKEVWGLVANEAIHCGCPVLASQQAGATPDIIINGVNGVVCDTDDIASIKASIRCMMQQNWDSQKIRNSLAWATPAYQANKIIEACKLALN